VLLRTVWLSKEFIVPPFKKKPVRMRAGDNMSLYEKFAAIKPVLLPTGVAPLDLVLGGGLPSGTYVELASAPGVGKTTMVLYACRRLCDSGHKCVYLDHEQGVNASQLDGIGLTKHLQSGENPDGLFVLLQPCSYEDTEEILDVLLLDPTVVLVVIDSITMIYPEKLREKSVTEM
jgi:RecA/RadA recombinase